MVAMSRKICGLHADSVGNPWPGCVEGECFGVFRVSEDVAGGYSLGDPNVGVGEEQHFVSWWWCGCYETRSDTSSGQDQVGAAAPWHVNGARVWCGSTEPTDGNGFGRDRWCRPIRVFNLEDVDRNPS